MFDPTWVSTCKVPAVVAGNGGTIAGRAAPVNTYFRPASLLAGAGSQNDRAASE